MLMPTAVRPALPMVLLAAGFAVLAPLAAAAEPRYSWRPSRGAAEAETLAERIAPPPGFERRAAARGSFAAWLRGLPLRAPGAPVLLYDGTAKPRQDAHVAVIEIDVGSRDLQQCADAAMRLRAEWLFASGRAREVAFNATGSGQPIAFARWAGGERPKVTALR